MFDQIVKDGIVPLSWKLDRKTLIFKGGDPFDPGNNRLIAIHSIARKVFTKIMETRIRRHTKLNDVQN